MTMIDRLVEKIGEETELEEDDIRAKIEEKEEEFSGLVSEEGAAHLVAKEHGVNLAKDVDKELKIDSVVPGMSNVNIKSKVVDITPINTFTRDDGDDGKVRNIVLGDETGTLRMSLWDEQTDVAEKIDVGDNVQIANAYSREDNQGNAELRIGDSTQIKRIDEDEIGEVKQTRRSGGGNSYEDVEIDEIMDENARYRVDGQIVQIYTKNPFYQVCPECGDTLKKDNDYECSEHGDVDPDYRIALPIILDDGFDNVRCVLFNDTAKKLLDAEDVDFDGDTEKMDEYADNAIGERIVVEGRSQHNDFFDTIELVVDDINKPSIDEQIQRKLEAIKSG